MALDKRTLTLFRVSCDICGAWAPEAESREEALLVAEEQGFRLYTRWNGLEYISAHLCEGCSSEGIWVKDGKYGDMERVSPEKLSRQSQEPG